MATLSIICGVIFFAAIIGGTIYTLYRSSQLKFVEEKKPDLGVAVSAAPISTKAADQFKNLNVTIEDEFRKLSKSLEEKKQSGVDLTDQITELSYLKSHVRAFRRSTLMYFGGSYLIPRLFKTSGSFRISTETKSEQSKESKGGSFGIAER